MATLWQHQNWGSFRWFILSLTTLGFLSLCSLPHCSKMTTVTLSATSVFRGKQGEMVIPELSPLHWSLPSGSEMYFPEDPIWASWFRAASHGRFLGGGASACLALPPLKWKYYWQKAVASQEHAREWLKQVGGRMQNAKDAEASRVATWQCVAEGDFTILSQCPGPC